MAAEIKKITTIVEEGVGILPGQMLEMDTPAGTIQVLGTETGFAVRRPLARVEPDIRYEDGETITFKYKDGSVKIITAVKPEDWQAVDALD